MAIMGRDYEERVYAGVLGKIIGVYLGRPFEGWPHARIVSELGEIKYYVHERLGTPLIVTDDDIAGTFSFLRAMPDYGNSPDLTPAQIGQTWLNYLIEEQTVLWWGGMGNSTEHTAYLRLKSGVRAPLSGSIALNGKVVAEQIGAQIFVDGWAMICPGDPERAADLARRAASVSHDGEAIYGAQVIAGMEAQAFVESDINKLLDVGSSLIPPDSVISRLIGDLREWHARYESWYDAFHKIVANYGYDKYGGNCHMVPNHALIILALLYCENSYSKALTIVNTAGWDTDCNSGNVGCLMGIKNGLAGLRDGPDLRAPVADRLYLPTADGGRAVSDALHEAYQVIKIGRALAGESRATPKGGARYHFDLPGATQGWVPEETVACRGTTWVRNVAGHSTSGSQSLAVHYHGVAQGRPSRVVREISPAYEPTGGYHMAASPALYPSQTVRGRVSADQRNGQAIAVRFFVRAYGDRDREFYRFGPTKLLTPGSEATLTWAIELQSGCPISWLGLELSSDSRADGTVYVDWVDWSGVPRISFNAPEHQGRRWLGSWVQACDTLIGASDHTYRLVQNEGVGLAIQGMREWADYRVKALVTPHLAESFGLGARVQGLRRYYALTLTRDGVAQLVRELDGTKVLAETPYPWELYRTYAFRLEVRGRHIVGLIDGERLFEVDDPGGLDGGAIALLVDTGRLGADEVSLEPLGSR